MHQQALARDILAEALRAAAAEGGRVIRTIRLALDPADHVGGDELMTALQLLAQGTLAEGAEVVVRERARGGVVLESIDVAEVV